MWGALSDERTDVSFTIAAGSCQSSHSRVRVPRDSRPYFTVSLFVTSYDSQDYGGGIRPRLLLYSPSVSTETPVDHPYPVSMDTSPRNGLIYKNSSPQKRVLPLRSLKMCLHVTLFYLLGNIFDTHEHMGVL
jgi:hypothetical protein